jgi:hypothetical protein
MEMSDVMLVRNRPADRALPAVRQPSALRAQQALRCPHLTLLSVVPSRGEPARGEAGDRRSPAVRLTRGQLLRTVRIPRSASKAPATKISVAR